MLSDPHNADYAPPMGRFVLVHGAWHDAWCWERLTPELEALGHTCVTVSLPAEDPAATFETYAEVVADAVDKDSILVGHSLAGLTIPLVAARTRVRRLVYLCSLVPIPGRSFFEQLGDEPGTLDMGYAAGLAEPDDAGRRGWADPELAWQYLYGDLDRQDAGRGDRADARAGDVALHGPVPARHAVARARHLRALPRRPPRPARPRAAGRHGATRGRARRARRQPLALLVAPA